MKGCWHLLVIGIVIVIAPVAVDVNAQEAKEATVTSISRGCGAYATTIALRRSGRTAISIEDVEKGVDPDGDGECSLADMQDELTRRGLTAECRQGKTPPSSACIVRLRRSHREGAPEHFVFVEPTDAGDRLVYYAPFGVLRWEPAFLERQWDGYFVSVIDPERRHRRLWVLAGGAAMLGMAVGMIVPVRRERR